MIVGIMGFGFVGQALYGSLVDIDVEIRDPLKGKFGDIERTNMVFICVSTPTINGRQDITNVIDCLESLTVMSYKGVVVIKSTVQPDNAKELIKKFNELKIVFNPEFLNQNNAVDDFVHQNLLILGGDIDLTGLVAKFYRDHTSCFINKTKHCSALEACYMKYIHNIYHAYKVLFWEYVQTITGNERLYAQMYEDLVPERNDMSRICADGKRGFGGACFPKDLVAMHGLCSHDLTEFMIRYNLILRPDEMDTVL